MQSHLMGVGLAHWLSYKKIIHTIAINAIDPIAVVRINVVVCAIIFHLDGSVSIFKMAMLVTM